MYEGTKKGSLTALHRVDNDRHGNHRWAYKCDCGNTVEANVSAVSSGSMVSCGCRRSAAISAANTVDLRGMRVGRLLVLSREGTDKYRSATWLCQCDCGNTTVVSGNSLRNELTRSCGCLRREITKDRTLKNIEGRVFGQVRVGERTGTAPDHRALWNCTCSCGNTFVSTSRPLVDGTVTSCKECHR